VSDFADAISDWDGVSVDLLKRAHQQFVENANYPNLLVAALTQDETRPAGTWLIKHHVESGSDIDAKQLGDTLSMPDVSRAVFSNWQDHLHMLQIMPFLRPQLIELDTKDVAVWSLLVSEGQESAQKFVRAWAWQGAFELLQVTLANLDEALSRQDQADVLREDFAKRVEQALEAEKGAVAARLRKVIKQLNAL
jgi:hypothetical protein